MLHNARTSQPNGRNSNEMLFCQLSLGRIPLAFYFEGFMMFNRMQKMTSITPSIYEIIHLKVFFKNFVQNFYQFQGFRPMIGPLRAIPSICNQRSLVSRNPNILYKPTFEIKVHAKPANSSSQIEKNSFNHTPLISRVIEKIYSIQLN